ncbi:MAG: hypothetical protein KGS61_02665 [Verrucomicrobia bacterium]|nr:hypothetical protein [Verrucomicrobiota bacterium]
MTLLRHSPSAGLEEHLFADLLRKPNQHLLEEIHSRLAQADHIMVPWGVAHMPGIARGIQQAGFRLRQTRQYLVIRFQRSSQRPE